MKRIFRKTGVLAPFILTSLFAHALGGYLLGVVGPLKFGTPVNPVPALDVTLKAPAAPPPSQNVATVGGIGPAYPQPDRPLAATAVGERDSVQAGGQRETSLQKEKSGVSKKVTRALAPPIAEAPGIKAEESVNVKAERVAEKKTGIVSIPVAINYETFRAPVRQAGEFLASGREKLVYRVTLLKVPVGSLEIEACNREGELRITARIKSNAVISGFYPVDDLVETRMINGNYLLTRVRQNEGDLRGDFGFTLMLREHKAFWVDRLAKRYDYQPLPEDDVTDALAGFYFLRNRELEVGKTLQLHLFDGSEYFPAKVHVLRRERVRLADLRFADTIVIRPELPASGLFRKNHDMVAWLTDDENKVPVKLECDTPLGRVTAELVSSEAEPARTSR